MPDWVLTIDFGTTFTVAAVAEDGRCTLVDAEGDGSSRIASATFLAEDGTIVVGSAAYHQAVFAPDRFEPTPKRWVGEGELLLGDRLLPVAQLIGAVMAKVAAEAMRLHGGVSPIALRLTHPADWGKPRTDVLVAAAEAAGLPEPELIEEPVAAAIRIAAARIEAGQHVAVYDFGGGTFDAAVLRRTASGFEVAGPPGGRDPLGGEDIDQRIVDHLSAGPVGEDPDWPKLLSPPDVRWRRAATGLRAEVRKAKEGLSRTVAWQLWVPGIERELQLTRAELEALIRSDIEETLEVLASTIESAGCSPDDLAGIFMVGGSSRIPLVADAIWRRFGRRPDVQDDPKAVVALGAAGRPAPPAPAQARAQAQAVETPMPGEGEEPARRGRPFRSRLAMATTTPLWSKPTRNYAMLALEGEGLTVRVSDEPVPAGCDVAELARAAAGRWAHAPGYAERSLEPATVLGFGGGLERRLVCEVGGAPAQWLERYVAVEGHGLVVTAHERARAVADGLAIGRPALDPQRFYEPAFTAELPDGWTAVDRVELVRVESRHRVIAESRPVALGTSGQQWADACAGRLAAAPVATDRGRLFGMGEAVVNTFRSDDSGAPTLTRIWTTIVDGRGYSVSITLPEQDRYGFKLLVAHAALAGQPRVSLGGLAALVDPAGAPT